MNAEPAYRVGRNEVHPVRGREGVASFGSTAEHRLSAHPDEDSIDARRLARLPATVDEFFEINTFGWEGTLRTMFTGTRDKGSPLALLREYESTIVREIHSYISNRWASHVKLTVPAALVGNGAVSRRGSYMQFNHGRPDFVDTYWTDRTQREDATTTSDCFEDGFVSFARCGRVVFPKPADRNVNMMPFRFGDGDSLPEDLRCYFPLIEQCPYLKEDEGRVGYLTVHESFVDAGDAQRREGLHIESPGTFSDDPRPSSFAPGLEHHWGAGHFYGPDKYDGGIFLASSVSDTSTVWDALVDNRVPGIVDRHGGCEHLRGLIGRGTRLVAGELVWMTDCTPHEALPQVECGYRQFFRVVTPRISQWHADHCTENPRVPLPSDVTVVRGDKFAFSTAEIE